MSAANSPSAIRRLAAEMPLALAYGLLPVAAALSGLGWMPRTGSPNTIWLVLAGLGLIASLRHPAPGKARPKGFAFRLGLFLLALAGLVLYQADILAALAPAVPYLKECGPVAYLLFGLLWAATFGLVDRSGFQKYGALLGAMCCLDLGMEIILFRTVPTVRLIGNADVLAGLLLVALCAGLRPGKNQGGITEPDQGRSWWRALIMLGIPACLSRTALFGAAWVILCFGRGRFRFRALYAVVCLTVLAGSFLLPATLSDAIRYTDYWLWVEAIRLFTDNPSLLLTGLPVPAPLPVEFPVGMGAIWEAATGAPATFGAFLAQVPSFWLRLTLAWGAGVPLALLAAVFILLLRRLTRLGAGMSAALFAQGMTTPLLFDPATGVCVTLAFVLALTRPSGNVRRESEAEATVPRPPDPTEEWDLRPL